jgi:streptomycin 6-kinase
LIYALQVNALPEAFSNRIERTFGQPGKTWLENFPALLDQLARRWSLSLERHLPALRYNYVAPARQHDGNPVVLKLGVPNPELTAEIAALRHFDGRGAVRLIDADPESGALLLERIQPGSPVLDLNDDERATSIAASVIRQLHRPAPEQSQFPCVADWGRGLARLRSTFNGGSGPFPRDLVERAEWSLRNLAGSESRSVLLHADLHHWNILASRRSDWLAIDPKGLIGEPEYEAGAWLRNPITKLLEYPDTRQTILRRLDQFVDLLGFDRERMTAWSLYQAVLAAWWSYEESDPLWEVSIEIAAQIAVLAP